LIQFCGEGTTIKVKVIELSSERENQQAVSDPQGFIGEAWRKPWAVVDFTGGRWRATAASSAVCANRFVLTRSELARTMTPARRAGSSISLARNPVSPPPCQMRSDRIVKDPRDVVNAGDIVKVRVVDVDLPWKRIA
jgi:hypothetical protein